MEVGNIRTTCFLVPRKCCMYCMMRKTLLTIHTSCLFGLVRARDYQFASLFIHGLGKVAEQPS